MRKLNALLLIITIFTFVRCENEEEKDTLKVSTNEIVIDEEGGTETFVLLTDADSWTIENPHPEWLKLSETSGTHQQPTITISVVTKTLQPRTDTLTILAGTAEPVFVIVSQAPSEYLYEITTDITEINLDNTTTSVTITVSSDAPEWNISADEDWVLFSKLSGNAGTTSVKIWTSGDSENKLRTTKISLSAENTNGTEILLTQLSGYPSYNTNPLSPDNTGMESTATELASKIKIGWNLGNTLEATGGETSWGNPKASEDLIKLVKQNGFNAIRIPCSWNIHMENSATAKISSSWLNRVKEVVKYCTDNDLYVLLNIHWDGGWLENNCTPDKQASNNAKQKAFWEQIATHLRDFDEHLIFASANEPNVENATQMSVLLSYHQTFINAVRSTGGKNSHRVLVVQGPSTDIEKTNKLFNTMPTDEIANKLMAEVHYYTPYQFCLMTEDAGWGKMFYYWGNGYHSSTDTERNATWGEESDVNKFMSMMKTKFIIKGIPVILGEYGAIRRTSLTGDNLTNHLASRAYYLKYVTKQAKANGIIPFYWDEGGMNNNTLGIFNRNNNTVFDKDALDALIQGASE